MRRWLVAAAIGAIATSCSSEEPAPFTPPQPDAEADVAEDTSGPADAGGDAQTDAQSDADMAVPPCEVQFLGPDDEPFETLEEYCLFSDDRGEVLTDGVLPFDPIAVLYADESLKDRFVAVPDGTSITFDADARWTYPVGTILGKSFYYYADARDPSLGRTLLETRLLVNRADGWEGYIYIWNDEQTSAVFERLGEWRELERVDDAGATVTTRYRIPNQNQCNSCHEQSDVLVPLGPRAFQLHSDYDYGGDVGVMNQLQRWSEAGILDGVPADLSTQFALTNYIDDTADIDARARSYLEVNCAHCHNAEGAADSSGLHLSVTITEPGEYGVCRRPVAAGEGSGGLFYDIVPGDPAASIMVYRMSSTDPEIKMPELPTQTSDDLGVTLVSDWIAAMTFPPCD